MQESLTARSMQLRTFLNEFRRHLALGFLAFCQFQEPETDAGLRPTQASIATVEAVDGGVARTMLGRRIMYFVS